MRLLKNPANNKTIYSEHFQQLNRSKLQGKFCMAAFMITYMLENICFFLFQKSAKYMKRTKKLELNLIIEFGRVVYSQFLLVGKIMK